MLFITPLSRRLVRSGMESRRFEMMAGFFDERAAVAGAVAPALESRRSTLKIRNRIPSM